MTADNTENTTPASGGGLSDEAICTVFHEAEAAWSVDRADLADHDRTAHAVRTETADDESTIDSNFDPAADSDVADQIEDVEDLCTTFRRLGF